MNYFVDMMVVRANRCRINSQTLDMRVGYNCAKICFWWLAQAAVYRLVDKEHCQNRVSLRV